MHQRNNIIAANRQKLHQSTVKPSVLRVLNTANDALRLIYSKIYGKEPQYLGGGVVAEKLGRGVRPASQNPYPIYDQNLRFSLPYL